MKRIFFLTVLLLHAFAAHALNLSFLSPHSEGDTETAKPYIQALHEYLQKKTGLPFSGDYFNDEDEAVLELQSGTIELAIVSPDFFEAHHEKYEFHPVLKTIPIYAERAYEKYYIYSGPDMQPSQYVNLHTAIKIFASRPYARDFVRKLSSDSLELRNLALTLNVTDNLITQIRNVSQGKDTAFVLFNGYENSVIEKMKTTNADFARLKLVYTSPEMPSAILVNVKNKVQNPQIVKIQKALLGMVQDPEGAKILNDLRLKGFAP